MVPLCEVTERLTDLISLLQVMKLSYSQPKLMLETNMHLASGSSGQYIAIWLLVSLPAFVGLTCLLIAAVKFENPWLFSCASLICIPCFFHAHQTWLPFPIYSLFLSGDDVVVSHLATSILVQMIGYLTLFGICAQRRSKNAVD